MTFAIAGMDAPGIPSHVSGLAEPLVRPLNRVVRRIGSWALRCNKPQSERGDASQGHSGYQPVRDRVLI